MIPGASGTRKTKPRYLHETDPITPTSQWLPGVSSDRIEERQDQTCKDEGHEAQPRHLNPGSFYYPGLRRRPRLKRFS